MYERINKNCLNQTIILNNLTLIESGLPVSAMKQQKVRLLVPRRWEETESLISDFLAKVDKGVLKNIQFELNTQFELGVIFIENPEVLKSELLLKVQKAVEKLNRYVLDLKNDPWTVPAIRSKTVEKMRKELFSAKSLALEA